MKHYLSWISEAIVILTLLLIVNNYLGNKPRVINADGKGYYDYLPATFIYHDLNFHFTDTLQTALYTPGYSNGYLKTVYGKQIDKYFPGAAILWTPFFLGAHVYALNNDVVANGYSWPYQKSIFYAAIFYLWIGLFFLRKVLSLRGINTFIIFLVQLLFALGTPMVQYVQHDPAFTHVYSFALISAFTFFSFKFIQNTKLKDLLIASFILGLIAIIRPVNLMAVLIIPLYFDSFNDFIKFGSQLFTDHLKPILIALIPFILIISIVPLLWFYQTGHFFIWGYQKEGFNFLDPEFINFLFSFKRGALIHTPLLLLSVIGGLYAWIKIGQIYKALSFLFVLSIIVYILSSWWSWSYGASFGSRPTIDFYILFAIALAQFLNSIRSRISQVVLSIALVVFIPINIIQAYQYQHYIMDWNNMTYAKFKIIGLHTEDKYRSIFFIDKLSYTAEQVIYTHDFKLEQPIHLPQEKFNWFEKFQLDSTININQINYVHIQTDIEYCTGTSVVILSIDDKELNNIYWHEQNIFASTNRENERELCHYYYKIKPQDLGNSYMLAISSKSDSITIHSLKVTMLNSKPQP